VLAALGVHALVIAVAPRPLHPRSLASPATSAPEPEKTWEVDEEREEPPTPPHRPEAEETAPARAAAPRAKGPALLHEVASMPAPVGSLASALEVPTGSWTFSPVRAGAPDISLGDARYHFPVSAEHATTEGETAHAPRRPLEPLQPLEDRDVELGLGRGSPVVGAVEEAAQASDALGSATFDVSFDSAGGVKVALLKSTGASWDGLRSSIARLVSEKHVRLSAGHGLKVRVDVEAQVKLADGRDVRSLGTHAAATLGQVGTTSVAMAEMPNVRIEHNGKVCVVQARIDPTGPSISGGCSPENIGVPPKRVVAAREVSEARL